MKYVAIGSLSTQDISVCSMRHRPAPGLCCRCICGILEQKRSKLFEGRIRSMATKKTGGSKKSSSGSDPKSKRIVRNKMEKTMHEFKHHDLESGRSGKKVRNPKQAIAIGLSEARRSGADIPASPSKKKRGGKKAGSKKAASKKSSGKKTTSKRSRSRKR